MRATGSTGILEERTMDVRKSAVDLSSQERDRFLEAVIRLKHRPAPGPVQVSRYDQFVALHRAVMVVIAPGLPAGETVNYGHWNIGFCPWHRKYVREFEKALQAEVPGVTVPYWDWADHEGPDGARKKLFVGQFLASLRAGSPAPVTDSVLRNPVPQAERPTWWPAGADGYPIHPQLQERWRVVLARGTPATSRWPPPQEGVDWLERLVIQHPDVHPFWYFWLALEGSGRPRADLFPTSTVRPRFPNRALPTHNAGHNFIGGHMSGNFSPNDPIFWLHHSNVDRLWANWQARRLQEVPNSTPANHYPPPEEEAPFGDPQPPGHRLDDQMWPWVDDDQRYGVNMPAAQQQLLPDFSDVPATTVRAVLDTETIGYRYAAPEGP
jgi:tyrosinase